MISLSVRSTDSGKTRLFRPRFLITVVAIGVVLIFTTLAIKNFYGWGRTTGDSMLPTLPSGSWIIYKKGLPIDRGDIVTVSSDALVPPGAPTIDEGGTKADFVIKRVVGLPGDLIEIRSDATLLNGDTISEYIGTEELVTKDGPVSARLYREKLPGSKDPYVISRWDADAQFFSGEGIFEVEAGKYFLMGDARDRTWDSRHLAVFNRRGEDFISGSLSGGGVPQSDILGVIIFPSAD